MTPYDIAVAAGQTLYSEKSSKATTCAQANLKGRSLFADPGALNYHACLINDAGPAHDGLFYYVRYSEPNPQGMRKHFFAVFDLFGDRFRDDALNEYASGAAAAADLRRRVQDLDPTAHYTVALARKAAQLTAQADRMRNAVTTLLQEA